MKMRAVALALLAAMAGALSAAEFTVDPLNGDDAGEVILWSTGGASTWGWDRKPVELRQGTNTIRLTKGVGRIDHLNVLWCGD